MTKGNMLGYWIGIDEKSIWQPSLTIGKLFIAQIRVRPFIKKYKMKKSRNQFRYLLVACLFSGINPFANGEKLI